jgi:fermentation-respiration switch protein FrsA (DUF1100 family)
MRIGHIIIVAAYLLCPVIVLARALWLRAVQRRSLPLRRFRLTSLAGMMAGVLISVTFALSIHGRLMVSQVLLCGYLATSLILILQIADTLLWNICRFVFQLRRRPLPSLGYNIRALMALGVRAAVVICIGIPYVLATMMTYRPRAESIDDPTTLFNWRYESVNFAAVVDHTRINGWWIPSPGGASVETVILCPGSGADKAGQLSLVKRLLPDGYNVLVIDFRGHGDSGGQLCSFGDLERRDVLGAVRWLRETHPSACQKIAGIGVSTGGAALLAAAADPSVEGQNIDAVAVYGTFDRLDHETAVMVDMCVPMPLSWFVNRVGLPLAGWQVGADLKSFAPAEEIKAIWPRPVLVIHGMDDEFVPFEQGQSLYDSALEPKQNFWISRCNHTGAIKSDAAAKRVKEVFDSARRLI